MTSILQRVKGVGTCPPSLLIEERATNEDNFDETVQMVLDPTIPSGLSLGTDAQVEADFEKLLKMTSSIDSIPGSLDPASKALTLEQRRAVVVAIVGSTPSNNETLRQVLDAGVLVAFKSWVDDILNEIVGGMDLLLHMLSSIRGLPVTKSVVKSSGMGKVIGTIEKHRICVGSGNEDAIQTRVAAVKEAWNASVKALGEKSSPDSTKREYDQDIINPNVSKKAKTESSSFASLMKKVAASPPSKHVPLSKPPFTPATPGAPAVSATEQNGLPTKPKSNKRVKWADHFGGMLDAFREIESNNGDQPSNDYEVEVAGASWQDRKKRDRLREKELLAQAKRSKLTDEDDDLSYGTANLSSSIKPTTSWNPPRLLPERSDVTTATLDSKEVQVQADRMKNVAPARYRNEYDVPVNPASMSDVEQALDMTSQASAIVATIPFFVPQAPAPAPVAITPTPMSMMPMTAYGAPPPPPVNSMGGASVDFVASLGLPMFLVGSNQQALQTLASTPSLLNTFVDASGMYDQPRLTALVHTLSQSMAPTQQPAHSYQPQHNSYGQPPPPQGGLLSSYAPPPAARAYTANPYGPAGGTALPRSGGSAHGGSFHSDSHNSEGNLHVSGFGPMTSQAEIIQMFAPYVHVHEVVMKGTFCFVNTRDPDGAARAREALNGTYLGGMQIRINLAQRRNRDVTIATTFGGVPGSGNVTYGGQAPVSAIPPAAPVYGGVPAPSYGSIVPAPSQGYGGAPASTYGPAGAAPPPRGPPPAPLGPPPPRGGIDVNAVRDDRGNPATKNLFVAGYGPGTSEGMLRDIFSQHAIVTGCVMKGSFTFVNTGDRMHAVVAREALMGTMVNGGVLRVNFAKETGRLGTSFDLTYGPSTAPQRNTQYGPAGGGARF